MGSGGSKALWSSAKLFLTVLSLTSKDGEYAKNCLEQFQYISVKSARLQSNRVADRTTAMEGGSPLNAEAFLREVVEPFGS